MIANAPTDTQTLDWETVNQMNVSEITEGLLSTGNVSQMLIQHVPIVGEPLSVAAAGISTSIKTGEERAKLEEALGMSIRGCSGESDVIKEGLKNLDNRTGDAVGGAATSAAGAIAAGTAAGTLICPGLGTIGGFAVGIGSSIVGSIAGQQLYDSVIKEKPQDTLEIIAKLHLAQKEGVTDIPEGVVAAALLSSMPIEERNKAAERLKELTGTKQFHVAVANGDYDVLAQVASEFDVNIRASTGMVEFDDNNPERSAASMFAQAVNCGQIDACAFVFNKDHLPALEILQTGNELRMHGVGSTALATNQTLPGKTGRAERPYVDDGHPVGTSRA